jgi:hypothetical protein
MSISRKVRRTDCCEREGGTSETLGLCVAMEVDLGIRSLSLRQYLSKSSSNTMAPYAATDCRLTFNRGP